MRRLILLAVLLGLAGCGTPAAPAPPAPASAAPSAPASLAPAAQASATSAAPASAAPQPAGSSPSLISQMICTPKTATEIAQVMGAKASVAPPTWTGHRYACGYRYQQGIMTLSVKEVSSWPQTYGYFGQLAATLHKTTPITRLGQDAFIARDGSVVVRKDWKILLVDISGLHGAVGSPPKPPAELAIYVAEAILGCWAGD